MWNYCSLTDREVRAVCACARARLSVPRGGPRLRDPSAPCGDIARASAPCCERASERAALASAPCCERASERAVLRARERARRAASVRASASCRAPWTIATPTRTHGGAAPLPPCPRDHPPTPRPPLSRVVSRVAERVARCARRRSPVDVVLGCMPSSRPIRRII